MKNDEKGRYFYSNRVIKDTCPYCGEVTNIKIHNEVKHGIKV